MEHTFIKNKKSAVTTNLTVLKFQKKKKKK